MDEKYFKVKVEFVPKFTPYYYTHNSLEEAERTARCARSIQAKALQSSQFFL